MVHHQAVAIKLKGIAFVGLGQRFEERQVILGRDKNGRSIIPAVYRVIEQTISDGSWTTRHADSYGTRGRPVKRKNELTLRQASLRKGEEM